MPNSGADLDLKLDLCGHCLFPDTSGVSAKVERLAEQLGLSSEPYHQVLRALSPNATPSKAANIHAFLGVGIDPQRRIRLDLYLRPPGMEKPCGSAVRSPLLRSPRSIHCGVVRAIERASMALFDRVSPAGEWRDFDLPVGASTSWVTAYIGDACLEACAHASIGQCVRRRCGAAARSLLRTIRPGGWGFNLKVPTDADSTAMAILFLRRLGLAPLNPGQLLADFANPSGGYTTYSRTLRDDAWANTHSDVAPTVVRAVYDGAHRDEKRRAIDFVLLSREPEGNWRSYWWRSDLFATEVSLRVLCWAQMSDMCDDSASWLLRNSISATPFEQALHVRSLTYLSERTGARAACRVLISELLDQQQDDGLWAPGAWLRVTDPGSSKPWVAATQSGNLYLDRGLFTSGTVVSSLVTFLQRYYC
jgi:hypothetical protein